MQKKLDNRKNLYWLDWLRFIASLLVVVSHARGGLWVDWGRLAFESKTIYTAVLFAVTRLGGESVLIFFVLSGFLVGGKLIERLENKSFEIHIYVIDRFTRIWIPLVPALFLSAVVAYQVGKPVVWLDFFGNLIGLQGILVKNFSENNPLWSLAYEIWFYFLAGWLATWIISKGKIKIIAGFLITLGFMVFTKLVAAFLFSWIVGALTYWFVNKPCDKKISLTSCVFIISGLSVMQLQSATVSVDTTIWLSYIPSTEIGSLLFSLGIALAIPYLTTLEPTTDASKMLDAVGSKIAAFSYTLYLTHYPILYLWEYFMPGRHDIVDLETIMWYIIRIASCVILGWMLYLPFEMQTTRARKWLLKIWNVRYPKVGIN